MLTLYSSLQNEDIKATVNNFLKYTFSEIHYFKLEPLNSIKAAKKGNNIKFGQFSTEKYFRRMVIMKPFFESLVQREN